MLAVNFCFMSLPSPKSYQNNCFNGNSDWPHRQLNSSATRTGGKIRFQKSAQGVTSLRHRFEIRNQQASRCWFFSCTMEYADKQVAFSGPGYKILGLFDLN